MSNDNHIGYELVHDMFSSAKTHSELLTAVHKSIQIMKKYNLDSYQRDKLEQFGIRCFNNIDSIEREIAHIQKTNKKSN